MRARDAGVVTSVEMMFVLIAAIVAVFTVGYLGRLHAAGVEVTNAAQSAARVASQQPGSVSALTAARAMVDRGPLASRCSGGPGVSMRWSTSAIGTWQGGSVTVEVRCTVINADLSGVWSPGVRTIVVGDTQPIDRYRR